MFNYKLELEKQLKKYLDIENIALYTNGHSALECSLEALDLKGKIITTPFSFASTTHAIVRKGLLPVFADIKEDDYTIDPRQIEKLVDSSTCAIMPVHVYGNVCDIDAIDTIAKRYNLKVIYDAAHAFGVKKDGVSVAKFGDISMFSFHATKVFNTIEGGALCFKNEELRETLNHWKNFGIVDAESVVYVGGNAKMNEFCASMGICNLRHIDEEIDKRKKVAECYLNKLQGIKGIKLNIIPKNIQSNFAYFPVVFTDDFPLTRNQIFRKLSENGILSRKYFYPLITDYACYKGSYDSSKTPIAKYISDRILTLPIYADLSLDDVNRICDCIVRC